MGDPFAVRRGGVECPVEHSRRDSVRRAHTGVRRHQSLNAVEAAGEALHEQVAPDPPRARGAIARKEAGPQDQPLLVGPRPDTRGRVRQT